MTENSPNNGHFTHKKIAELLDKPDSEEIAKLTQHQQGCEQCNELVSLFKSMEKLAAGAEAKPLDSHFSTLDLTNYVIKTYQNSLTPQQAADYLNHIKSCPQCFSYTVTLVADSIQPVSEKEEKELQTYAQLSLSEKVLELRPAKKGFLQKLWEILKKTAHSVKKAIDAITHSISQNLKMPVPVIQFLLVILTLGSLGGGGAYVVNWQQERAFWAHFVYDNKVPFEYDISGFRSQTGTLDDTEYRLFHEQILIAISDYMAHDYENAILRLESLEPSVNTLMAKSLEKEKLATIRDLYFYLGVSHFALSRSEARDLSEQQKEIHNEQAVQYFLEAQLLAAEKNLAMRDRETFFLGLALGFGLHKDDAVSQLKKIMQSSPYFEKAVKLMDEWSEE